MREPVLYILYPVTPTLSVEAVHARLICDEETAIAESPVGIEGAVVSEVVVVVAVAGCAGTAGVAGTAEVEPPPDSGAAGVAGIAGTAGVAGIVAGGGVTPGGAARV